MYLKKLEIFGFKSFAEKTSIEFSKGVSAIVGPNGSGKSNIVDALRWVLGEQGDKALRSEKREDVVFSGTRARKPLSIAEVSLHIVNDDGILPTEYSEVMIARRFYRSGETEYYLNGTKVRLKDLRAIFVDTGIGPDAYSVIELKMVENILSPVKNERRKMFEEAAGIISYKQNRDLTFNRLKAVHESLLRVNDIIREKQRNVNALERQVKRNEEAKVVSDMLKNAELYVNDYEFRQLMIESDNIRNHEHDNITLKETLAKEISEFDSKIDEIRSELKVREHNLSAITSKLNEAKINVDKIERENLVLEQQQKSNSENKLRLLNENANLQNSIGKHSTKIVTLEEKIVMLRESERVSSDSLSTKKTKLDDAQARLNQKKEKLIGLNETLKDYNKELQNKRSEYEKSKLILETNFETMKKLTATNANLLLDQKQFDDTKVGSEKQRSQLQEELKSAEKVHKDLIAQKKLLEEKINSFEQEQTKLTIETQKLQNKTEYLKNLLENFEDYAEGVRYLVKEKHEEKVKTVIDAIQVGDKFKIPVETALGEVSNYLILDDSKELNRLMNLLINNNKGKVTFILNDKLGQANLFTEPFFDKPEFIDDKGVYGFADEFIECTDKKYFALVKYLLEEYVIVENIDTAIKYAKDNFYKFITLDGDIITDSFVRAGSATKESGIKLGREKEIEKLENEIDAIGGKNNEVRSQLETAKEQMNALPVSDSLMNLEDIKNKLATLNGEISQNEFKVKELSKTIANNEKEFESAEIFNKELDVKIESSVKSLREIEAGSDKLEQEISTLTIEHNESEENYKELLNEYNSFNLEYTKLVNELKYEEEELGRVKNTIENHRHRITINTAEIETIENTGQQISDKISGNNAELISLKQIENSLSKTHSEEKSLFDEKNEEFTSIDIAQRDRRIRHDKVSQLLIDSQIKMKENEIKSQQIKDYIRKKYETGIPLPAELLTQVSPEDTGEFDLYKAKIEVDELSERLKKLGGGYQQFLFEDFKAQKDELEELIKQKEDLLESERDIRKTIEKINAEARLRFLNTFEEIRKNFIKIFNQLFQEGDEANLRLVYDVDEEGKINEDPLEAKIEIIAKPRGKRPTSIELLSGGEKTLTAIALLFAIYLVKPSPFCVLDEVDAPLDVANLMRFNNMIRSFSDKTQFILITHNERTMEVVDRLYGVTMQEPGVTTIVETRFKD